MRKATRKQKKLDKLREEENQKSENNIKLREAEKSKEQENQYQNIHQRLIAVQNNKVLRAIVATEGSGYLHDHTLCITAKDFATFAKYLSTNTTLGCLHLESTRSLLRHVAAAFKVNTSIKSLLMERSYIYYNDNIINFVFPLVGEILRHNTSLTRIHMPSRSEDNTWLVEDSFNRFIDGFKNNKSLTRINIPAYHYHPEHMAAYLDAIKDHPNHPLVIDISQTWDISTNGMQSMALLLHANLLRILSFSKRDTKTEDDIVPFFEALKTNTSLTQLSFSMRSNIFKKESEALSEALLVNTYLTKLHFTNGVEIGSESMSIILDSLHHNTTLVDIKFWDTKLDNNISPALGRLIQFNETLTEIDLPRSQINAEGCKIIGPALRNNRSITSLRLLMNPIGSEGVKHLCEGLKWNKALIRVHLSDCQIDDVGCEYIGEAIKTNQCLLHLDISGTPIKEKGYRALIDGMKENQSLTDLTLSKGRTVSSDIHEEIYKAQNKNKEYQRQLKVNTITMLIQIARSDAFDLFPLEIWLRIFKHFVCGGVPGFNHIAETILMNSDVRDLSSLCKMKIVRINGKSHLVPSIGKK